MSVAYVVRSRLSQTTVSHLSSILVWPCVEVDFRPGKCTLFWSSLGSVAWCFKVISCSWWPRPKVFNQIMSGETWETYVFEEVWIPELGVLKIRNYPIRTCTFWNFSGSVKIAQGRVFNLKCISLDIVSGEGWWLFCKV